jgi:OmpA-OmpF porin, OOP family
MRLQGWAGSFACAGSHPEPGANQPIFIKRTTIEDTMRKLLIAATLLLLGTSAAYAQLPDVYVGAGISRAQLDDIFGPDVFGNRFNLHNTAWKAFAGFRPIPFLGIEANYMDLGSESHNFGFNGARADAHAFSGFAVGFLPLPLPVPGVGVDLFAKAGAARWTLDGQVNSSLFAIDDHGTNFAWGLGGQAHFGPLGVRLEYEQFDINHTDGAKVVSLDVAYHFL